MLTRLAAIEGPPVSLVGGAVRDALLGGPAPDDLDVVVEGDALVVARRLGRALGVRVVAHERFGTAVLELPHGGHLDLVTARRETYARPAALPDVAPGTLADDLARRDFTINAMAHRLTGPGAGELVDPHGGAADLAAGVVRALRDDQFVEDPSRLLRAARYAARLGFSLAPETEAAARAAAAGVDLSSARVGEELRRLLTEPAAGAGIALAAGLGVPGLRGDAGALTARFAALDAALARPNAPGLPRWALRLGVAVPPGRLHAVAVPGWARALARAAQEGPSLAAALAGAPGAPSATDALLARSAPAAAVSALAMGAERVAWWWAAGRDLVPDVTGADLVAAGVAPGPAIGRALAAVRAALLDGEVASREQQLALALRVAAA